MKKRQQARYIADPTMRKCVGFAKRGGAGGMMIVNMAAYSETHPRLLVEAMRAGKDRLDTLIADGRRDGTLPVIDPDVVTDIDRLVADAEEDVEQDLRGEFQEDLDGKA